MAIFNGVCWPSLGLQWGIALHLALAEVICTCIRSWRGWLPCPCLHPQPVHPSYYPDHPVSAGSDTATSTLAGLCQFAASNTRPSAGFSSHPPNASCLARAYEVVCHPDAMLGGPKSGLSRAGEALLSLMLASVSSHPTCAAPISLTCARVPAQQWVSVSHSFGPRSTISSQL